MANVVKKIFTQTGTLAIPAGITQIKVSTQTAVKHFDQNLWTPGVFDINKNLYLWGLNNAGQLGNGVDTTSRSSPTLVVGSLTFQKFQTLSQQLTTVGLTTTGAIYSWGTNNRGQLGDGTTTSRSSPVLVAGGLTWGNIFPYPQQGSTELTTMYAALPTGQLYAWGLNQNGQLGDGTTTSRSSPVLVAGGLTWGNFSYFVWNGSTAAFGLTSAGVMYAWGVNQTGQIGDGTTAAKSSPTLVAGSLTFQNIFLSPTPQAPGPTVYGLTTSGTLYAWGSNNVGQIGDGTTTARSSPVLVLGGISNWRSLQFAFGNGSGSQSVYGLTSTGQLYSWGNNSDGELGDNSSTGRSSPVLVSGSLSFNSIYTCPYNQNSFSAFGLTNSGQVYGWGLNLKGVLGDGTSVAKSSPVLVVGGLTFSQFFYFGAYCAGITPSGQMYTWGDNTNGDLGDGTTTSRSSPVLVVGGLTWVTAYQGPTLLDGSYRIYGITTNGLMYSWGGNATYGALGDGTTTSRSSPVLVAGSLPLNMNPTMSGVQVISVIPGQTYTVSMNPYYTSVGPNIVGQGLVDQVNITFEQ